MYETIGKDVRWNRLFGENKKTVMVALDHGQGGVKPGLEHPEQLIRRLISAKPDGILLSSGMARRFHRLFQGDESPSLIISSDFILKSTIPGEEGAGEELRRSLSVEEAITLGADAIKALLVFGKRSIEKVSENMMYITQLAEECFRYQMPLIVEPTTWGSLFTDEQRQDPKIYAHMARISAELGADMVKVEFVGSADQYQAVLDACPVPIVILGGSKSDSKTIANTIHEANKCGVSGVVFGRNVWQSEDPEKMIEALKAITYQDNVKQFFEILEEKQA